MNNETELKNTINSILAKENWVEFVKTATCCDRKGCFFNLKKYNCYDWYKEIDEQVKYYLDEEPLYKYLKDKEASEQLKNYYKKATENEDWDEYDEKEIEILSNLDADNLVVNGDWEVNHIYEINDIEYLDEDETQVIIAEGHTSRCWGYRINYLVYDINKEEIEEVLK